MIGAITIGCLVHLDQASAEVEVWQFGGEGGQVWGDFTNPNANILMDDFTVPSALQPRELDPDVNILPQLGPWQSVKNPPDFRYRDGQPRIWRGIDYYIKREFFPDKYVDGDPGTAAVLNDLIAVHWEYYTIDVGGRIPAERFRFYPPEGIDHISDVPYRPNFNPAGFELSAGSNAQTLELETAGNDHGLPGDYKPLEEVLFTTRQHYEPTGVIDLTFPLQYQRFFRIRAFPESEEICEESGIARPLGAQKVHSQVGVGRVGSVWPRLRTRGDLGIPGGGSGREFQLRSGALRHQHLAPGGGGTGTGSRGFGPRLRWSCRRDPTTTQWPTSVSTVVADTSR